MSRDISSNSFTILASKSTQHFAKALEDMNSGTMISNTILLDDFKGTWHFHSSIVSLTLIDIHLAKKICSLWSNAVKLVTISKFLNADALSYFSCIYPMVEIHSVNLQTFFTCSYQKKIVSDLKVWAENHPKEITSASNVLHSDQSEILPLVNHNMETIEVCSEESQMFVHDGIYIVVGGLTGLGWICVEFLAKNNAQLQYPIVQLGVPGYVRTHNGQKAIADFIKGKSEQLGDYEFIIHNGRIQL